MRLHKMCFQYVIEPAHEIMALRILRKLILQTGMRSHTVGIDVWFLVGLFVYFHISCVWTVKTLARLRGFAGSPEPSLIAYVISTLISWAGSHLFSVSLDAMLTNLLFIISRRGIVKFSVTSVSWRRSRLTWRYFYTTCWWTTTLLHCCFTKYPEYTPRPRVGPRTSRNGPSRYTLRLLFTKRYELLLLFVRV